MEWSRWWPLGLGAMSTLLLTVWLSRRTRRDPRRDPDHPERSLAPREYRTLGRICVILAVPPALAAVVLFLLPSQGWAAAACGMAAVILILCAAQFQQSHSSWYLVIGEEGFEYRDSWGRETRWSYESIDTRRSRFGRAREVMILRRRDGRTVRLDVRWVDAEPLRVWLRHHRVHGTWPTPEQVRRLLDGAS